MAAAAEGILRSAMQAHQAGRLDEAERGYRAVLASSPSEPNALHMLGLLHVGLGRGEEGIALIRQAISVLQNFPEAYCNLGNALHAAGRNDEAIAAFQQALKQQPHFAPAMQNLGVTLHKSGRHDEAINMLRALVARYPGMALAHLWLARALRSAQRREEAIAAFCRAVETGAGRDAVREFADELAANGATPEALGVLEAGLQREPDAAELHNARGFLLMQEGRQREGLAAFREALCLAPEFVLARDNLAYGILFDPEVTPAVALAEARAWDAAFGKKLAGEARPHGNVFEGRRRLRIGYVSADFWEHPCGLFLHALLPNHDHNSFEVFCYSDVAKPDAHTARLRAFADHWREVLGVPDVELAETIRADAIDILVDLKLHTTENRLGVFARKAAPVQVSWLGYPGTTGLSAIDYRLSDWHMDPPGADAFATEEAIRLPDCFWCYDALTEEPAVSAAPCLANGFVTFGCLNNFIKVHDGVLDLWGRVLVAVPDARLLLLGASHEAGDRAMRRLDAVASRVDILPRMQRPEYLKTYHRIDIALDTFPYNGHTTSLDALWMGVPVVTMFGTTPASRAGLSQLSCVGLQDLAAGDSQGFVDRARALAQDHAALAKLRSNLRNRMRNSPLMDGRRFAANMEQSFRLMWQKRCASQV